MKIASNGNNPQREMNRGKRSLESAGGLDDGWAWGQLIPNFVFLFSFKQWGSGQSWSTVVIMCAVPCFLWSLIVTVWFRSSLLGLLV